MHSPAIFEPEISMKSHTYKPDPDALPDVKPEFNCVWLFMVVVL